jgi:hypothetical protein
MVGLNTTNKSCILILLAALLFVMPSAAINAAVYGDTAGFSPDFHKDIFTIVYSLPGSPGSYLDSNITKFTDPNIDVIFMGGEDTFSPITASLLEKAVASGKIFVVSNYSYQKFDSSLPATSKGFGEDGKYFFATDPDTPLSKQFLVICARTFPTWIHYPGGHIPKQKAVRSHSFRLIRAIQPCSTGSMEAAMLLNGHRDQTADI